MNDLAEFEERRLAELKHAVAARAAGAPAPPRRGRTARVPRGRAVPLAAAGAAVAVGAVTVVATVGDAAPAYAVTRGPGGIVNVDILRYDDADGLSRQLRKAGVPASVYYVPAGKVCHQPHVTTVDDIPPGLYSPPMNIPGKPRGRGMRLR